MIKKINNLIKDIKNIQIKSSSDLENFKMKILGKKGQFKIILDNFKKVSSLGQKKIIGEKINFIKKEILNKINLYKKSIKNNDKNENTIDLTIPYNNLDNFGAIHPISIIKNRIFNIFSQIGFEIVNGKDIEDDWHNFTALNFPLEHPSRDMHDTFFIEKKNHENILLRTHTSSIQIRYMKYNKPPIRIISYGNVYRKETISAKSHYMFHQIEGLYINKNISFLDLKSIIKYFINSIFKNYKFRFRPSYFPFTKLSSEIDIYWGTENQIKKNATKGSGWLEIMGCGMVDSNVLKNVNIDSKKFSGFAFGIGIERIALILYNINDIRTLYKNNLLFLKQFKNEF